MNDLEIIEIIQSAMWVLIQIATPVMLIALMVGLVISLFQALTQIQEMTLSFVPKIIAIFFSIMILIPFMFSKLGAFTQELADKIVSIG